MAIAAADAAIADAGLVPGVNVDPYRVATVINGKASWFGGPHDPSDSGHTASGGTTAEPGIAIYNPGTLGGYWRVHLPNGRTAVLKQTDIGPAPWTGKKVDFTYSALKALGYTEKDFPTGGQVSSIERRTSRSSSWRPRPRP